MIRAENTDTLGGYGKITTPLVNFNFALRSKLGLLDSNDADTDLHEWSAKVRYSGCKYYYHYWVTK